MHLVKSISLASSQQIRLETQEMGESGPKPGLFPSMKEYLTEDSTLILIDDGANSNIRAFYVAMLQYIVQGMGHYNPEVRLKSFKVLTEMKKHLYRKNTVLTCIKNAPGLRVHNDPRKNTAFTSLEMKKLLGEFFHLLIQGSDSKNKIQRIFEKYSFIPILMNIFIRSLLWLQYDLDSASDYTIPIDDESVFNCLSGLIGLEEFNYSNELVICFECHIVISSVNFIGQTAVQLRMRFNKVYMLHYYRDLFKDLTFSEKPQIRYRAQTEQAIPENDNKDRQKYQMMSIKTLRLRRYDSYEEEIRLNGDPENIPESVVKDKGNFQKYRSSVGDTFQFEKCPVK